MPVDLRNPLKNHSIMWQIGQFYPCFFRANLVCGFLQQYQRNKGVTNRAGCHNRNGRHSLWCVLSSKQRASKGAPKFGESAVRLERFEALAVAQYLHGKTEYHILYVTNSTVLQAV